MTPTGLRRVYLDTSVYLSFLLNEEDPATPTDETVGAVLLSSVLLALEARRGLVRLARERKMTIEHYHLAMERLASDLTVFVLRDLTLDLCEAQPLPAISTPRSLDLVHLRTARWFHREEPIDRFLTLDASQRAAARELGLPV